MLRNPRGLHKAKARLNDQFAASMVKPPLRTFYRTHPLLKDCSEDIVQQFYDCLRPRVVEPNAPIVTAGDKVRPWGPAEEWGGGLARGYGFGWFAFGGACWPLATGGVLSIDLPPPPVLGAPLTPPPPPPPAGPPLISDYEVWRRQFF